MTQHPLPAFLVALENITQFKPKRNGSGWLARCPAHDDRNPSLSISEKPDGRVLLHCHAGCAAEEIVKALGLTMCDLMLPSASPSPKPAPRRTSRGNGDGRRERQTFKTAEDAVAALTHQNGRCAARWSYTDVGGETIGIIVRWNLPNGEKDIRPVSRTATGWVIGGMASLRPLYRLPELKVAERVYIAEGEPAVEALRAIGLIATTSAHGSKSAAKTDWSLLAGKKCVILPDNDDAGRRYADDVVRLIQRIVPQPVVRIVTLPDLPASGDAVDYVAARRAAGMGDAAIRAEVERLADAATPVESDEPPPPIESYKPFPVAALPSRIRRFVLAVAAATGTDPAFAALTALVVLAGCVGNRAVVVAKSGWSEPSVLWGAIVGRSGTTKSPVLKLVTRALVEIYKGARREYEEAQQRHAAEMERYIVALANWKSARRGGKDIPGDPPMQPEPPTEQRLLISDTTVEKLVVLLQANPLGLMLVRDELAAWVGMFDRYAAGGKGSDCPSWLSMYDAGHVINDRKGAVGPVFADRAAVSVIGSIQPGTLARCFGRAEREAGLLARLLVVYPPERPAVWSDAELPDAVAAEWADLIQTLLAMPAGEDDAGAMRPRHLPIERDAKVLFIRWHNTHAAETADAEDDDLGAHFSKLKGACLRIALVLACVEVASSGQPVKHVTVGAMRQAIMIADWFKSEARRVYAMLSESEQGRCQRQLADWIRRRGGDVTVRDLTHGRREYRGDADAARAALDELMQAGLGRWVYPAPGSQGGRPSELFVLHDANPVTKTPPKDSANGGFGYGDSGDDSESARPEHSAEAPAEGDSEADDWGRV